ncbi:hypothetical protein [Kitasatospora aureofaciens]|uniref:hypothetical protein n=1 Tax=Kitasatospora aureofaciens TaxID=1894 RepID=UPI001C487355|nr:hypothetical protein [Kitasatospora aureofaciens]MBV6698455.1 hypothetical protein [Kitasatospora aureofaciens]
MGCFIAFARVVIVVFGTWLALIALLFLPALLPARWQYYIYSPASVGLWMLSMLVAPIPACLVLRKWISAPTES